MVVRNRICEEKRARVVPVVFRFDNLRAGRGDELAEIKLSSVHLVGLRADVCLFDVIVRGFFCCAVDEGICAAKEYIDVRTDRIGVVIDRELGCAEVELVGLVVEVVEIVDLPVRGVAGPVGVVAVVAIEVSAEIERAQTPDGRTAPEPERRLAGGAVDSGGADCD